MKIDNDDLTDCEECGGTGWLQHDLGVFDEGFGELERCECRGIIEVIESDPEAEPKQRDLDLRWTNYTE